MSSSYADIRLARRTRLRPDRPTPRRAAVPAHHRTRRTNLRRARHQRALQRMGQRIPRSSAGRRDRRPGHLQRPHSRDRHRVPPAMHQQDPHPAHTRQRPWRIALMAQTCEQCGHRLPRPMPGAGRLMRFCSPACRQKAYRARWASIGQDRCTTTTQHQTQPRRAIAEGPSMPTTTPRRSSRSSICGGDDRVVAQRGGPGADADVGGDQGLRCRWLSGC